MVGMACRAVPARVVAGGTNIRAKLAFEGVAPLRAARTSQRDVPTTLKIYICARGSNARNWARLSVPIQRLARLSDRALGRRGPRVGGTRGAGRVRRAEGGSRLLRGSGR